MEVRKEQLIWRNMVMQTKRKKILVGKAELVKDNKTQGEGGGKQGSGFKSERLEGKIRF